MKSHCAMYVWVIQAHLFSQFSKPKLLTIALPVTNIPNQAVQKIWQNKTTKCFCSRFMDSVVKSVSRFLGLAKLEYKRPGHEIFALRIFSHSSSYCVVAWLFCRWITRVQDKMSKFDSCIFNGNIIAKPQTILSYKCCCGLKRISVWLVQNVSTHHSVVQCAKFW